MSSKNQAPPRSSFDTHSAVKAPFAADSPSPGSFEMGSFEMGSFETRAVHGGRGDLRDLGFHAAPIDLSTTYPLPTLNGGGESLAEMALGGEPTAEGGAVYSRLFNPTVDRFEKALARLEGAQGAVSFASGMAALTAALIAGGQLRGRHIVAVRPIYGGSDHLLSTGLLGFDVTWAQDHEVHRAIRPDTALVLLETPANPTLDLVDIEDLVAQAGEVPVLVDSTFATPVLQRPIEHGAALVLHSATKFLGGHGDVMGGVIACRDDEWLKVLRQVRIATGGVLHPFAAYLLHRGLQTLPIRVEKAQANAAELAKRLLEHDAVDRVFYPGLGGSGREIEILTKQMSGAGCVLSFELKGGHGAASSLMAGVRLMTPAVSLGSVDTLIQHPAALTHRLVSESAKEATGISPGLIRLAVGLENVEDLWNDLAAALDTARQPSIQAAAAG